MTAPPKTPEDDGQPTSGRVEGEARAWMVYLLSGAQDEDRNLALEAWLRASPAHSAAMDALQASWDAIADVEAVEAILTEPAQNSTNAARQPLKSGMSRRWALIGSLAAAAMIAITAGVTVMAPEAPDRVQLATATGEIRTFTLPDGSEVTLGGKSSVTGEFDKESRSLTLATGNAFFDIASDETRPLLVTAGAVRVKVLGTRFDVHQRAGNITVAVEEGRVAVTDATSTSSLELTASNRVDFSADTGFGEIKLFEPARGSSWRDGRLSFVNAPLSEIVAEVNQYSATPIVLTDEEIGELRLTLSFTTSQIDKMLAGLEAAQNAEVTHTGKDIRISSVPPLSE